VQRGIRPSASPVAATADRPAGLVVYGWGAAGAGLADGDIITMVGGRQPRSVDDVVIAVAGAYKSPHKVVSGQIWRKGRILAVTVELPTGKARNADKPEPAPASGPVAQRASSRAAGAP
jgi:S1-C subfamily serine protease